MRWEHKSQPLISPFFFILRLGRQLFLSLGIIVFTLSFGTFGFMSIGHLPFVDAYTEASLLLSGAGTIHAEHYSTSAIKTFASFYALFSTLVVLTVVALIFAPVIHRILHHLHLDKDND